jgi:hypothetical protein
MKTINVLDIKSDKPAMQIWQEVAIWILGLLWLVLLFLRIFPHYTRQIDVTPVAQFVMVIACGLLSWVGAVFAKSLGVGAWVLGQRQVPIGLWRHWLLSGLKKSLFYFGLSVFAVVTFALPLPLPLPVSISWHGLTAVAVLSSVLGVSVLRGLALQGLAPRLWARVGPLLLVLILVGSVVGGGFAAVLSWIDKWPWIILFGVTVSWPMLALMLTRRGLEQVPRVRRQGVAIQATLWEKVKAYALRYTALTVGSDVAISGQTGTKRSAFLVGFGPIYLFWQFGLMTMRWGTGVQVGQVWWLGLITLIVSGSLVCKDLHWRMLLTPAGMRRGALGWHIALSTISGYFAGPMIVLGVVGTVALAFWPTSFFSFDLLTSYLARICIAPVHLVFAISVGTLILGTLHTRRWEWGLAILWGLAGLAGLVWGWIIDAPLSVFKVALFTVGYPYVFALLALSALAVWAANRLWTVEKLLRYAPK